MTSNEKLLITSNDESGYFKPDSQPKARERTPILTQPGMMILELINHPHLVEEFEKCIISNTTNCKHLSS